MDNHLAPDFVTNDGDLNASSVKGRYHFSRRLLRIEEITSDMVSWKLGDSPKLLVPFQDG